MLPNGLSSLLPNVEERIPYRWFITITIERLGGFPSFRNHNPSIFSFSSGLACEAKLSGKLVQKFAFGVSERRRQLQTGFLWIFSKGHERLGQTNSVTLAHSVNFCPLFAVLLELAWVQIFLCWSVCALLRCSVSSPIVASAVASSSFAASTATTAPTSTAATSATALLPPVVAVGIASSTSATATHFGCSKWGAGKLSCWSSSE